MGSHSANSIGFRAWMLHIPSAREPSIFLGHFVVRVHLHRHLYAYTSAQSP